MDALLAYSRFRMRSNWNGVQWQGLLQQKELGSTVMGWRSSRSRIKKMILCLNQIFRILMVGKSHF